MKFVCLGYIEPDKLETMPENDRNAMADRCFAYDDVLRKDGHFAAGEALQPSYSARTLELWERFFTDPQRSGGAFGGQSPARDKAGD